MSKQIMVLYPMWDQKDLEIFKEFLAGEKDVDVVGLTEGEGILKNRYDVALAAVESIRKAKEAESAGYKAIVCSCTGDPNIEALREAVRIPVVGVLEASMHFASMLGHNLFSIIVAHPWLKRWFREGAMKYGLESHIASIRVTSYERSFKELAPICIKKPTPKECLEPVLGECIKAVRDDYATAIVLCGMFLQMKESIEEGLRKESLDVPVINPVPLGVDVAKVLINQNLAHSPRLYPLE